MAMLSALPCYHGSLTTAVSRWAMSAIGMAVGARARAARRSVDAGDRCHHGRL